MTSRHFAILNTLAVTFFPPTAARGQQGLGRIVIGERFPQIELAELASGRRMTIDAFQGRRVLLLVFASW